VTSLGKVRLAGYRETGVTTAKQRRNKSESGFIAARVWPGHMGNLRERGSEAKRRGTGAPVEKLV
jgi:hypothetical protein